MVPGTGRETKRLCPRGKLFSKIAVRCISFRQLNPGLRYKCDVIHPYEEIQLFVVAAAHLPAA